MKLDGATISIQPRPVGACIDLACLFYRVHFRAILLLTLFFAGPVCVFNYWWLETRGGHMAFSFALFYWISPYLGSILVAAAGQRVFGDPFVVRRALQAFAGRSAFLLVWLFGLRLAILLGALAFILPGFLLAAASGFFSEVLLLEQVGRGRVGRRLAELVRGGALELTLRLAVIVLFFGAVVVMLFLLADAASGFFFGFPLFAGRLPEGIDWFAGEVSYLLFEDPRTLTALLALMWFVYPLARLAWFFCYLDVRIRKELWDVELDFRIEARRLEAAS